MRLGSTPLSTLLNFFFMFYLLPPNEDHGWLEIKMTVLQICSLFQAVRSGGRCARRTAVEGERSG